MINKVILVGNVGIDPEVRTIESGAKVARVRLATTERLFDRQANETKEHTEWHTVTLWRGLADVVDRYVRKGSQIYIEGRLRTREWTDKDGNKRYTTEILADDMKLLGRRGDNAPQQSDAAPAPSPYQQPYQQQPYQQSYQQSAAQPQRPAPVAAPADDPDDLPF
ncbi:MAG: single-stranded DNA-binding protein [Alistipes sp.]|nr:single-stranded DNA-binding protein [Alistipes sp.]